MTLQELLVEAGWETYFEKDLRIYYIKCMILYSTKQKENQKRYKHLEA